MNKLFYLQTYDFDGNQIVLDNHRDLYEPFGMFSICMYVADKFHRELGIGVTCYAYDPELKTYELMFDLVPEHSYLRMLKQLFEPHEV